MLKAQSVYLGHKLATWVISLDQIKVITATSPPLAQPSGVSDEKSIQQDQKTSYGGSLGGGGETGGNWVQRILNIKMSQTEMLRKY